MNLKTLRRLAAALGVAALAPFAALASNAGVAVRADLADPAGAPFPSNRFTVHDPTQNTLRRIKLPKPNCALRPSDCFDVDVLNTLDGFSTQPRITVPFDGDIDPASVNSNTVYLVNLGNTISGLGAGERIGIDQVVWDPATRVLAFQSAQLLRQHSRYLLAITDGVRDAAGRPIRSGGWGEAFGRALGGDPVGAVYRASLRAAVRAQVPGPNRIVAASLFTTQSITADLQKINRQLEHSVPTGVDFEIGRSAAGAVRAVFPLASIAGVQFVRQTGAAPSFTTSVLPTPALVAVPGAIGGVAYGRFRSPDYQTPDKVIPATGTFTGAPQPQRLAELVVQVFLPAGPKPPGGWPVALFGHGFTDSMYGAPWVVASMFASQGLATVSLNVVGHGGGEQGTLTVLRSDGSAVSVPAGGRGIDQDGDGVIGPTEGVAAVGALDLVGSRDGLRQTVVDYMALVRQIQAGVDVDGDGGADLDPRRIYYAGQSFGGIYGTMLLATEPAIRAGVPNVAGGSITEIARLSLAFRGLTGFSLARRVPALLNLPPSAALPVPLNFAENIPLRGEPPRINDVPGAMAIQQWLDRSQWATQAGNPVAYAPHLRAQPLPGHAPKPVILQIAKGDSTVPNPTSSAIVRAGGLADRVTFYRHDLAFAANPSLPRNPHTFLTNILNQGAAPFAIGAQSQIAAFFASDGALVVDPDGPGPVFEVPIGGPLPETLDYLLP